MVVASADAGIVHFHLYTHTLLCIVGFGNKSCINGGRRSLNVKWLQCWLKGLNWSRSYRTFFFYLIAVEIFLSLCGISVASNTVAISLSANDDRKSWGSCCCHLMALCHHESKARWCCCTAVVKSAVIRKASAKNWHDLHSERRSIRVTSNHQ